MTAWAIFADSIFVESLWTDAVSSDSVTFASKAEARCAKACGALEGAVSAFGLVVNFVFASWAAASRVLVTVRGASQAGKRGLIATAASKATCRAG